MRLLDKFVRRVTLCIASRLIIKRKKETKRKEAPDVTAVRVPSTQCSMKSDSTGSDHMDENKSPKSLRRPSYEDEMSKTSAKPTASTVRPNDQCKDPDVQTVSPVNIHELDLHSLQSGTQTVQHYIPLHELDSRSLLNGNQTVQYYIPVCKSSLPCDCHPSSKWKHPFEHYDTPPTSTSCTGELFAKSSCKREHGEPGQTHFVNIDYAFPYRRHIIESILASQPSQRPANPPVAWTTVETIPRCCKISMEAADIDGIRVNFARSQSPLQEGTETSKYTVLNVSTDDLLCQQMCLLTICGSGR